MKTLLGEQGGDSGHRTEHSLQLEEVKALRDSSTRTPLCSMSQVMSDNVRKAAAGLLGWEDMLVVITCWCVLGYHFSRQADGSAIEMRVPKGLRPKVLQHHTSYRFSLWGRKGKILIYSLDRPSLDPDLWRDI